MEDPMAKLPPDFVKAPAPRRASKSRSKRKTSLVTAERARDLSREVILSLSEDHKQELELARQELSRPGEEVSLEQMVEKIIAGWYATRTADRVTGTLSRSQSIVAQLRQLAERPLRSWRELGAALRRFAPARGN
jgi:hypothetical protein